MLLDGEAIAILPDATDEAAQHLPLQPGQFVYYPAGFSHTLESTGIVPANYLMLRWKGPDPGRPAPLLFNHFTIFDQQPNRSDMEGFIARLLFEGPTRYLSKLHCHSSTISPGSGYDVHCDDHDIVIIVLEGEVETLGKRATPHGAIFYRAGEPHGMFNPGETVARYVVFEFHST